MILNSRGSPKGLIDSGEGRIELASSWYRIVLGDFIFAPDKGRTAQLWPRLSRCMKETLLRVFLQVL